MNDLLPFLIAFAPFLLAFMFAINNQRCPDCETRLPLLISPLTKTRRQWLEGGWICPKCGIDVDSNGQKVEMPHVVNWGKTLTVLPLLIASLGVAIVLVYWALQTEPMKPAPPQQPPKMAAALPAPLHLPSHS
jgi:rubredoxin